MNARPTMGTITIDDVLALHHDAHAAGDYDTSRAAWLLVDASAGDPVADAAEAIVLSALQAAWDARQ